MNGDNDFKRFVTNYLRVLLFNRPEEVPLEVFQNVMRAGNVSERQLIAKSFKTPPDILHELATKENDVEVLRKVAMNPNCLPETLEMLSKNKSYKVRRAVSKNPNVPFGIVEVLSHDKSSLVRRSALRSRVYRKFWNSSIEKT